MSGARDARSGGKVVVKLAGGLGNQMFQYAFAYAFARRNGLELAVDHVSGFARDNAYRREYELHAFPIEGRRASSLERVLFLYERALQRLGAEGEGRICWRPWGVYVREGEQYLLDEVLSNRFQGNIWVDGFWQTERYFSDYSQAIARQFTACAPEDPAFIAMAQRMRECKAVAVGVRMFEEAPGGAGHWASPYAAYEAAASQLEPSTENRTFFVFCTRRDLVERRMSLPGPVVMVTAEEGYKDTLATFWLMQQCKEFILSNSSYYWWATWLAEAANQAVRVVAIDNFPHQDAIPARWGSVPRGA